MKRKVLAVVLAMSLLLPVIAVGAQAQPAGARFTIGNPYENVDWDNWHQFKAQLHVHTDGSDGALPKNEVIEIHYALDYDILAITDHMTVGVQWERIPRTAPLMRLWMFERTQMRPIAPLTSERRQEIITGVGRTWPDGSPRPMLEVTQGNELNGAVPSNNHLQGFFSDFGQGRLGVDGDWLRPVRGVHRAGGISVINHPGDVHRARHDDEPLTFFDRNPNWINKFAYLFVNYDSCVGMDINSGWGYNTRYDRMLYDRILERTIPHGVVPWAFTWSDAHSPGEFDRAWSVHLMTELTVPELRRSMEEGTFFGFARNAQQEVDPYWRGEGPAPAVNRITVNEQAGTIRIDGELYDEIVWVSHRSEIVHRGAVLDIAQHLSNDQFFVRAYLLGPGGILYVQPFTVLRQGQTLTQERVYDPFDYSVPLRWIAYVGDFLYRWVLPARIVWRMITWFDPQVDFPNLMRLIGYVA